MTASHNNNSCTSATFGSWQALGTAQWAILAAGAMVTAALSLGAHDLAIAHLGIPYPDESAVPGIARFAKYAVSTLGILAFCLFVRQPLARWGYWSSVAIVASLLLGLNELLRNLVIDWVVDDGWHGTNGLYILTKHAPRALNYLYLALVIVFVVRVVRPRGWLLALGTLLVAVPAGYQLRMVLTSTFDSLRTSYQLLPPTELYQPPYPGPVYAYIYGMFLEPAIAAIVMAALSWTRLSGQDGYRIAVFSALVLLIRGDLVTTLLYPVWSKQPWLSAATSEAQFFMESLLLGLLAALTWRCAMRWRMPASRIRHRAHLSE